MKNEKIKFSLTFTDWLVENLSIKYVENQDCRPQAIIKNNFLHSLKLNNEQINWLQNVKNWRVN